MKNITSKTAIIVMTALGLAGCQSPPNTTVNTNVSANSNALSNANFANSNMNMASSNSQTTGVSIESSEPEKYQATVTLKLETGGAQPTVVPPITAQVARSGGDRRMEFSLPNGEKIVYLDRGGVQYLVAPQRKQYAEITKESTGFDVRRLLMPEQIVSQVKNIKGVERVGEEKFAGRDAVKYRYNAVTETKSQAGNVATDSVIYVDKETNLPLRSETLSESQNSSVSGVKSLRFVTEMSNLSTMVDPAQFAEPTDFKKVAPEEIRGQVDLIFRVLGGFLQQTMGANSGTNPNANTNANAAPTATARP